MVFLIRPGLDFIPFNQKFIDNNKRINNPIYNFTHYLRIAEKYMESSVQLMF